MMTHDDELHDLDSVSRRAGGRRFGRITLTLGIALAALTGLKAWYNAEFHPVPKTPDRRSEYSLCNGRSEAVAAGTFLFDLEFKVDPATDRVKIVEAFAQHARVLRHSLVWWPYWQDKKEWVWITFAVEGTREPQSIVTVVPVSKREVELPEDEVQPGDASLRTHQNMNRTNFPMLGPSRSTSSFLCNPRTEIPTFYRLDIHDPANGSKIFVPRPIVTVRANEGR